MTRWTLPVGLLLLTACAGASYSACPIAFATEMERATDENGLVTTSYQGLGYFCSGGFAIELGSGEKLVSIDRQMDFLTHRIVSEQGSAVLYEGSAPQQANKYIRTGMPFPSTIAIHLGPEQPGYDADQIGKRIDLGREFARICA